MVYFVPPTAAEIAGIPNVIGGSIRNRIEQAFNNDNLIIEVGDEDYTLLRDTLMACELEIRVVILIPDVQTPKSYLHEIDDSLIINFEKLDLIPKDSTSEYIKGLKDNFAAEAEDIGDERD